MMKKLHILYSISALLLTGAGVISSCSQDDLGHAGQGYIQLSNVNVDKSVTTREPGNEQILSADILDGEGNTFVHADDWTTLQGKTYLVKAGSEYTIKAYSQTGSASAEGFDAVPYYAGENSVTVEANKAKTVDVTCKLAQAMVNVSYTDDYKTYMTASKVEIYGKDIVFGLDETRSAYVKAGQKLEVLITVTPQGGTEKILRRTIAEAAEPAYRYKLLLDVDADGYGSINVDVDQTIHEYEITLGVPLKPEGLNTNSIAGDYSKVWGQKATLSGFSSLTSEEPVTFKYRAQGATDWTTVNGTKVGDTNEYNADITGLTLGTGYEYKITCGESEGDVMTFTTERYEEIPNLNFDSWSGNSDNWYPNAVEGSFDEPGVYWATGNDGVTSTLAGNHPPITTRSEDAVSGYAAEMHTITGVHLVGSASGNLFSGKYKTNMSSPRNSVYFGRPYSGARPTKLSGWYKYKSMPITNGTFDDGRGITNDECNIYVIVWDADDNQIGFGEMADGNTVTEWTEFSFDINYTDTTKPAAKILIMSTSSRYGGEFSGASVVGKVGAGSQLYVDEFELSYE